jgi:hypothetical protein
MDMTFFKQEVCKELDIALENFNRATDENTDIDSIRHWQRQVEYFESLLAKADRQEKAFPSVQ